MIIEKTFDFKYKNNRPPRVFEIEEFIKSQGLNPVRYAILDKNGDCLKLMVSAVELTV